MSSGQCSSTPRSQQLNLKEIFSSQSAKQKNAAAQQQQPQSLPEAFTLPSSVPTVPGQQPSQPTGVLSAMSSSLAAKPFIPKNLPSTAAPRFHPPS